jgi:hypothetical protein
MGKTDKGNSGPGSGQKLPSIYVEVGRSGVFRKGGFDIPSV